jgi:hypothetical protein
MCLVLATIASHSAGPVRLSRSSTHPSPLPIHQHKPILPSPQPSTTVPVVHTYTPQADQHGCTSRISYSSQSIDYPRVLHVDNHSSSTQTTRDKSTLCSHMCRPHPPTNAAPLDHVLVMPIHKPPGVVPMTP